MKPIYAVSGFVAIILLALAGWFLFKSPDDQPLAARPPEEAVVPSVEETMELEPTALPPAATEILPTPTDIPPTATAEPPAPLGGTAYTINIPSPSLSGVVFGQDEEEVVIYLPPSYDSSEKHYPVLYILGGLGDLETGPYDLLEFNSLFEQGDIAEMVVVAPDGFNDIDWAVHFIDSPVNGDWPSFITRDLVEYIDANYRTISQPEARGLIGETMSGYGALNLVMASPDVFGVVYLNHPWLFGSQGLEDTMYSSMSVNTKVSDFIETVSEAPPELAREAIEENANRLMGNPALTIQYGWDFAGNPDPPYFEYPLTQDGSPSGEEIWALWEDGFGNIASKIEAGKPNLDKLAALAIAEGMRERAAPWTTVGLQNLREELDANSINYEWHEYDGNMYNINDRLNEDIMPFFVEHLSFE